MFTNMYFLKLNFWWIILSWPGSIKRSLFPMQFLIPLPVYSYTCLSEIAGYGARRMLQGLYSTLTMYPSQEIWQFLMITMYIYVFSGFPGTSSIFSGPMMLVVSSPLYFLFSANTKTNCMIVFIWSFQEEAGSMIIGCPLIQRSRTSMYKHFRSAPPSQEGVHHNAWCRSTFVVCKPDCCVACPLKCLLRSFMKLVISSSFLVSFFLWVFWYECWAINL